MSLTTVVNKFYDSYDVSIMRDGMGRVPKEPGRPGYFGNPFRMMDFKNDRSKVIELYRGYFYNRIKNDPVFHQEVLKLAGKKLGCICVPKECHGTVIAEYLNSLAQGD